MTTTSVISLTVLREKDLDRDTEKALAKLRRKHKNLQVLDIQREQKRGLLTGSRYWNVRITYAE